MIGVFEYSSMMMVMVSLDNFDQVSLDKKERAGVRRGW